MAWFLLLLTGTDTITLQEPPMPSDVRLTQAQKWDLVRMSGAAVVSTVFFGIPMFIARPEIAPPVGRSDARAADARPAADVSVLVSETVAPVEAPALEALPQRVGLHGPSHRRVASATLEPRRRRQLAPASDRSLARRLGRLLAGSGRYEVRPFPSLE
jgi:hypothetical protein